MHAISSYRGNRPTNKQTHNQTGPITIHCAAKLSAQCIVSFISLLKLRPESIHTFNRHKGVITKCSLSLISIGLTASGSYTNRITIRINL